MDVAIYLRKSRSDLEAEKLGELETLSRHRKTLTELAAKNNYSVIAVREEIAPGERISDRPEIVRLLNEVRNGEYDGVLCMDLDRLGRGDMRDQGEIISAFKDTSTLIITPNKIYNFENEHDETWSEFEAFMARQEYKMIKRRMYRGKIRSAKDGAFLGTWVPLGYNKDKDNHLVPNENAEIVRKIFHLYANENKSLRDICRRLHVLGVPMRYATEWHPVVVSRMLRNRVFLGEIHYGQKEKIIQKNCHPAIIDEELFNKAQERLKNGKKNAPNRKNFKARNPLAGILFCAQCGYGMRARESHNIFRYECRTQSCEKVRSERLDIVEKMVLDALYEIRSELKGVFKEHKLEAAPTAPNMEYEAIDKQLNTLQKQLSNLEDLLEQGVYSIEKYKERSSGITKRIQELKEQRKIIETEYEEAIKKQETVKNLIPAIDNLFLYYQYSTVEEKNNLLKTVVEKIIYDRPRMPKKWMKDDTPPTLDIHLKI